MSIPAEADACPQELELWRILRDVLNGLLCMKTQHGMAHGDVSMENVVKKVKVRETDPDVWMLIDFGHSSVVLEGGGSHLMNKTQYMSPEEASFNMVPDPYASDAWALGMIALKILSQSAVYESLTGRVFSLMSGGDLGAVIRGLFQQRDLPSEEMREFLHVVLDADYRSRATVETLVEHDRLAPAPPIMSV